MTLDRLILFWYFYLATIILWIFDSYGTLFDPVAISTFLEGLGGMVTLQLAIGSIYFVRQQLEFNRICGRTFSNLEQCDYFSLCGSITIYKLKQDEHKYSYKLLDKLNNYKISVMEFLTFYLKLCAVINSGNWDKGLQLIGEADDLLQTINSFSDQPSKPFLDSVISAYHINKNAVLHYTKAGSNTKSINNASIERYAEKWVHADTSIDLPLSKRLLILEKVLEGRRQAITTSGNNIQNLYSRVIHATVLISMWKVSKGKSYVNVAPEDQVQLQVLAERYGFSSDAVIHESGTKKISHVHLANCASKMWESHIGEFQSVPNIRDLCKMEDEDFHRVRYPKIPLLINFLIASDEDLEHSDLELNHMEEEFASIKMASPFAYNVILTNILMHKAKKILRLNPNHNKQIYELLKKIHFDQPNQAHERQILKRLQALLDILFKGEWGTANSLIRESSDYEVLRILFENLIIFSAQNGERKGFEFFQQQLEILHRNKGISFETQDIETWRTCQYHLPQVYMTRSAANIKYAKYIINPWGEEFI